MKSLALFTAALLLASPAFADMKVSDAHAFETSEGMKNGAVLLTLENTGADADKLIEASTPAADRTEIHEMSETNGVMKMREVGAVEVGGGKSVTFSPDGYHLMLFGLKEPLKAGVARPLKLKFLKGGETVTSFKVVSRTPVKVPATTEMDHDMTDMKNMKMDNMDHMNMDHK